VIQQWDHGGLEAHDYLNLGPLLLQTLTAPSGFRSAAGEPAIDRGVRKRRQMPREYLPPDPIAPEPDDVAGAGGRDPDRRRRAGPDVDHAGARRKRSRAISRGRASRRARFCICRRS
jgi:hypothetical protein